MKLAPPDSCTACMACVDACSHNILVPELDCNGYYRIKIRTDIHCTSCGMCTRSCPVLTSPAKASAENTGFTPQSFAVWTHDDSLRAKCASGGAFGAMARHIIDVGGVAYGAAIDGFRIRHMRAETHSELTHLLGSKYQHSETNGTYKQVKNDLRNGRKVLYSGLSCHVAGLIAYLGKTPRENLITVDTICGGLSSMLPMLALEKSGRYTGIHSFRDKEHGWRPKGFRYALKMRLSDGSIENLGLDNPVLNTFSSKLLKRSSCLNCKFNGYDRVADITIGDFWGDNEHPAQHEKGLSVAIVRSKRGLDTVRQSLCISPTDIDKITPCNPNLMHGRYPLVKWLPIRNLALSQQRKFHFSNAWHYMSPTTLPGVVLRIAIKISEILYH